MWKSKRQLWVSTVPFVSRAENCLILFDIHTASGRIASYKQAVPGAAKRPKSANGIGAHDAILPYNGSEKLLNPQGRRIASILVSRSGFCCGVVGRTKPADTESTGELSGRPMLQSGLSYAAASIDCLDKGFRESVRKRAPWNGGSR